MAVELRVDAEQLDAAMQRLKEVPYALQRAIFPAVGEMLGKVKDQLATYLQTDVPLPQKVARKAVKASAPRLQGDSVVGEVAVRSATLPLLYYDVQPMQNTAAKGLPSHRWPGFTFALRSGERRDGNQRVEGASLPFIAQMPNGHMGVYYRTATQLKQSYGPTVQYHVANPEVEQSIVDDATFEFPEILQRYVDQALAGFGGEA